MNFKLQPSESHGLPVEKSNRYIIHTLWNRTPSQNPQRHDPLCDNTVGLCAGIFPDSQP